MEASVTPILWMLTLSIIATHASFPENTPPISTIYRQEVKSASFTGGNLDVNRLSHLQQVKLMKVAGKDVLAITSRNNLYLTNREDFFSGSDQKISYSEIFTWPSDENTKNRCVRKGLTEEKCDNYLRVLESMDENGGKLLLCATNSYSPLCQTITAEPDPTGIKLKLDSEPFTGTEKCAFGPDQTGRSLYTDGAFYSATVAEFSGRSYTISRNMGEVKPLRTPKFDAKFLNEPKFIKLIDDGSRVLIFMNEKVESTDGERHTVAHVAQVCKNDIGGQHVLVRQWTTFVKTRLNCSMDGFYFDQLQDVSDPMEIRVGPGPKDTKTMVFATFTTPEFAIPGSAVCSFTLDAINEGLHGRFKEERRNGVGDPAAPTGDIHPGSCRSEPFTESQLQFLKSHPLLEDQAQGSLLSIYSNERWTSIAVDSAAGPQKNWTVYFVGTSDGELIRYLAPTAGLKSGALLKRQEIFDPTECGGNSSTDFKRVQKIIVDPESDSVLVAFKHCIKVVPLRTCSVHKCELSCMASADPYCGWDGNSCVSYKTPSVNVVQSIFANALHPKTEIEKLCPTPDTVHPPKAGSSGPGAESGPGIVVEESVIEIAGVVDNDSNVGGQSTDGDISERSRNETEVDSGTAVAKQQDSPFLLKDGFISPVLGFIILAVVAVFFFIVGICVQRYCCCRGKAEEERKDIKGLNESRDSNTHPFIKKTHSLIARISPKRKRKQHLNGSIYNHSNSTLERLPGEDTASPLITGSSNKQDEYVDVPDGQRRESQVVPPIPRNKPPAHTSRGSRLNSIGSGSQVTTSGSFVNYNNQRRSSAQIVASSVTSMSAKPHPNYATAPRPRNPSGNRSSDPGAVRMFSTSDDYSNAPTLRADKRVTGNKGSRHSTPVPHVPPSPGVIGNAFSFNEQFAVQAQQEANSILEDTEKTLLGVEEVIFQQQRRSQEMEPLEEDPDESRPRHDSSDSGKGESPRNSLQNEEERADTITSLGRRNRRARLNSEPASPTSYQPPMPPPSSRKPVTRSNSVQAGHMQLPVIPVYQKKRSGSFSFHSSSQPSTPVGQSSPPRNSGFERDRSQQIPQQHSAYSTLPMKPNGGGGRRSQIEQFNMQPYVTCSPYNQVNARRMYNASDVPHGQPVMMLPDKYSSLPARSQAHRSNKNSKPVQQQPILQHPGLQHPATTSARRQSVEASAHQSPHTFQHQWSSPATLYDPRSQNRPKYFPAPTVPTGSSHPRTVMEVNEV